MAKSHSEWRAGQFTVRTDMGDRPVAGWVKEPFALDFRVWTGPDDEIDRGWALTHIPTGYMAAGILAPLNRAFEISDEFRASADWDFTDPSRAAALKAAIQPIKDRHEGVVVFRYPSAGPLFAERLNA